MDELPLPTDPVNPPRSAGLSTETIVTIILAIIPLALALLTMESGYLFWSKVAFVALGYMSVWIISLYWEHSKKWRTLFKIGVSFVCSTTFLILIYTPLVSQFNRQFDIQLDFKDSPVFTEWIRIRTQYDLSKFRDYLQDLGLNPPIRTVSLEAKAGGFAKETGFYAPPDKTYEWTIQIGENEIHDRKEVTSAYLTYVLSRIKRPFTKDPNILIGYMNVELGVEWYIDSSYWNERKPQLFASPIFWQIRGEFGKSFGDRLAMRTLAIYFSQSKPDFCNAVRDADSSIDSDSAKWPEITKIMHVSENCTPLN